MFALLNLCECAMSHCESPTFLFYIQEPCDSSALCCSRIHSSPDCSTPTIIYTSLASWKNLPSFLCPFKVSSRAKISHQSRFYPTELFLGVPAFHTGAFFSAASPKPISTVFSSGKNRSRRPFKVRRYQHAWRWIKMFTMLVRHSRLCQWGPATVCKCITLRFSPPGSKLD